MYLFVYCFLLRLETIFQVLQYVVEFIGCLTVYHGDVCDKLVDRLNNFCCDSGPFCICTLY